LGDTVLRDTTCCRYLFIDGCVHVPACRSEYALLKPIDCSLCGFNHAA
jgi:hypothetical protein